jgi:hypothetical protein
MDGARMRVSSVGCGVVYSRGLAVSRGGGRGLVQAAKHLIFLEWLSEIPLSLQAAGSVRKAMSGDTFFAYNATGGDITS